MLTRMNKLKKFFDHMELEPLGLQKKKQQQRQYSEKLD